MKTVKANRKVVDYGDPNSPKGWWLEKNMDFHFASYMIPQKTMSIDLTNPQVTAKLDAEEVSQPAESLETLTFDRK